MKKLLLGLLGGAALGVLFAPEKGEKIRKKLSQSEDKLKDFGGEMLSAGKELSAEVQKFLESEEAQDFFTKGKENFSEWIDQGKTLSKKGKTELKSVFETVQNKIKSAGDFQNDEVIEKNEKNTSDVLADIKSFFQKK